MWEKLTRDKRLEIIDNELEKVEIQLKELSEYREVLEAEQLKLRLN